MKKFLAIALTLCMMLTSVVFVSAEETAEYGLTKTIAIDNCDDTTIWAETNGGVTVDTEDKKEGSGAISYVKSGEQGVGGFQLKMNLTKREDAAAQAINVEGVNRLAFEVYVSDASVINEKNFFIELTSAAKPDNEESSKQFKWKTLVNGWNTYYVDLESLPGTCDWTRFNFIRIFNNEAINFGDGWTFKIDNVRFENYVEEPVEGVNTEVHEFTVFAEDELPYLLRSDAGKNDNQRFSDQQKETVYKYTVTNRYSVSKVEWTAPLGAQLLLQVSQDDANWTTLFEYEYDDSLPESQSPATEIMTFDLTDKVDLKANPNIYIRIADSNPANGWGGSIYKSSKTTLTVEYDILTDAELDAFEAWSDENSIPLFGCNKAMSASEVDKENKTAGSGSITFQVGSGKVNQVVISEPIDGTGMDTLTFDMYISDLALFDIPFGNTGLELTSSGACDNSEISWKLTEVRDYNLGDELVVGWNHIILPLETATPDDRGGKGPFDISAINFIRFFMVSADAEYDITVKLDNMRLDNSGIERARIKAEEDQKVANEVIKLIDGIGEVTLDSDRVITKAENAYKSLTADQKALVTNKDAIKTAREAYDALVKAEEEKQQQQQTPPEGTEGEGTEGEGTEGEGTEGEGTEGEGNEGDSEESGCASSITIGAGAMMLLAAAWVTMAARKKED
ncbi:MAG: hypothetical protein IJW40_02390 [Clostridia bacterium]|nr:hypothetical protein [Clostridia bacterium]